MNNKTLLKFLILCFVMVLSFGAQAQTMVFDDFTEDFKKEDKYYYSDWKNFSVECAQKIINEGGITLILEFYDKTGEKYLYSLLEKNPPVPNGGIDISKPMILHLMAAGDYELPVKWYEFGVGCWMDSIIYQSNRQIMSATGKSFLKALFTRCKEDRFHIRLSGEAAYMIYPIGPFAE